MKTTLHSVRIADALWDRAITKAREQGTDLTAIIRQALEDFAPTPPPTPTQDLELIFEADNLLPKRDTDAHSD